MALVLMDFTLFTVCMRRDLMYLDKLVILIVVYDYLKSLTEKFVYHLFLRNFQLRKY